MLHLYSVSQLQKEIALRPPAWLEDKIQQKIFNSRQRDALTVIICANYVFLFILHELRKK